MTENLGNVILESNRIAVVQQDGTLEILVQKQGTPEPASVASLSRNDAKRICDLLNRTPNPSRLKMDTWHVACKIINKLNNTNCGQGTGISPESLVKKILDDEIAEQSSLVSAPATDAYHCPQCSGKVFGASLSYPPVVVRCTNCGNAFHNTIDNKIDWSVEYD